MPNRTAFDAAVAALADYRVSCDAWGQRPCLAEWLDIADEDWSDTDATDRNAVVDALYAAWDAAGLPRMRGILDPRNLRPSDLFRSYVDGPVYVVNARTDDTITVQPITARGALRPVRTVALADLHDRDLYPL